MTCWGVHLNSLQPGLIWEGWAAAAPAADLVVCCWASFRHACSGRGTLAWIIRQALAGARCQTAG